MRKSISKLASTAILALVIALTLSGCPNSVGDVSSSSNGGGSSSPSVDGDGSSSSSKPSSSSSVSSCIDGIVTIGTQTWQKCNLNVEPNTGASTCYGYDKDPANCAKYGRLYDWAIAMALPSKCNSTLSTDDADCAISANHQGVCPAGWHIPNGADWNKLFKFVDDANGGSGWGTYNSYSAGRYLKTTSGWISGGNGQDTYEFAALPGGYGTADYFYFSEVGREGYWWSATESNANNAYIWNMNFANARVVYYGDYKNRLFSVRCLQDLTSEP